MNLHQLNFYTFFTLYSRLDGYGFSHGLRNRLYRKLVPRVPAKDSIEYLLLHTPNGLQQALEHLNLDTIGGSSIENHLNLSIKALCSKIIAFGLDHNIREKYHLLRVDAQAFENLLYKVNSPNFNKQNEIKDILLCLESVGELVVFLRKNKRKIGTNIQLTATTRTVLEYISRVKDLLVLKQNITSEKHWKELFENFVTYSKNKNSIRNYLKRHSDLVALEIVEHTSVQGQKYIAENKIEYKQFFIRSLQGGSIIAVFALLKIIIESYAFTNTQNAILFSLNYALCFVIVKLTGGVIATKQPALTASTIVRHIDQQDDLVIDSIKSVVLLTRKVFKSQLISIIGNFLMALSLACGIAWIFVLSESSYLQRRIRPVYLINNALPSFKLVFYAGVAGIFLALSGLIAGYFDNKVLTNRLAYRIANSKTFFKSEKLAQFVEKKIGALLGNIFLGIFLGTAFLLSSILPFDVDIRHIAFSSANVGYSIMTYDFSLKMILLSVLGVLTVGLVNLVVSFSITFYLTLKSRGGSFRLIPKILLSIMKDFFTQPISYLIFRREKV